MQHGKNAAGFVGRSANWRNTVFVTLFLMMAARVMSSTATTTTVSQKEREGQQQQQQLDGDERHGRDEEKEEQVEEEDDDKEKEANGHGEAKGSVLAVDRVIVDHETEAAAIAVVVVPIVESVCGSTSTPNRSTDRTAAPISIGGKEMPTWSDVPPRCRMTTHSARSSWLSRRSRSGNGAWMPVCKYMNNVAGGRLERQATENETCWYRQCCNVICYI